MKKLSIALFVSFVVGVAIAAPAKDSPAKAGHSNRVYTVDTNVVGEGGFITPQRRAIPDGKDGAFKLHLDQGVPVVVNGCNGVLKGDVYTAQPNSDCTIEVRLGEEDDELYKPVIVPGRSAFNLVQQGREYLAPYVNCYFFRNGMYINPNWDTVKVVQTGGVASPGFTRMSHNMFNIQTPAITSDTVMVFHCEAFDRQGNFMVGDDYVYHVYTNPIREIPLVSSGFGSAGTERPVLYHGKKGKALYFAGKSTYTTPPETGVANPTTSDDTATWNPELYPVLTTAQMPAWSAAKQALPVAVLRAGGVYHLWVSNGDAFGHASSSDGRAWTVDETPIMTGGADLQKVFRLGGVYHFHYKKGTDFFVARSTDPRLPGEVAQLNFSESKSSSEIWYHGVRDALVVTPVMYNGITYQLGVMTGLKASFNAHAYYLSTDGVNFEAKTALPTMMPNFERNFQIQELAVTKDGKLKVCGSYNRHGPRKQLACATRIVPDSVFTPGSKDTMAWGASWMYNESILKP